MAKFQPFLFEDAMATLAGETLFLVNYSNFNYFPSKLLFLLGDEF